MRRFIGFLIFLPAFVCYVVHASSLRSQILDSTGLNIVASNGNSVFISSTQAFNFFNVATGTVMQRRIATRVYITTTAQSALGVTMIDTNTFTCDIDTTSRVISLVQE